MGWLRDSLRHSPHPSLGALARAVIAHPEWPASSGPQPRSLAALFSKLDRGLELEWLADRPAVQHLLAEILRIPRARIEEVLGAALRRAGEERHRIRFDDLPYASPLDLDTEALPPGIPESVLHPSTWQRLWWHAPAGSGRSLVGAWLAARGLATCVSGRDWSSAQPKFLDGAPAFVELWADDGEHIVIPGEQTLCVAAPFLPAPALRSGWTFIESPPPASWIGALVHWLALRLPRDGRFDADRAATWLSAAEGAGLLDTLGDALGLAGLVDEYGVAEIERQGRDQIAERFVRDRFTAVARDDGADVAFLERHGVDVLVRLGVRVLSDSGAWDAPRPFEEWVRLIAPEYSGEIDREWAKLASARALSPAASKELERTLRELPPPAFRVIRALERASLLRRTSTAGLLVPAPRWLARWTHARAERELVRGNPEAWGEAMLAPRTAGSLMRSVLDRALSGDSGLFDDLLDLDDPGDPARAAALETAFRAAGIALMSGVDVPPEIVLGLWDAELPLLVEREDGPHPRIEHPAEVVAAEPLLSTGAFLLSALALSEALPAHRGARHAVLRPWHGGSGDLAPVLDAIWAVVSRIDPDRQPWAREAFAIAERLRVSGRGPSARHPLTWPGDVLDAVERGTLEWGEVRAGGSPEGLRALLSIARQRLGSHRPVVDAMWLAWSSAPEPLDQGSPLSPLSPVSSMLFEHVPRAAVRVLLASELVALDSLPYPSLDEATFRAILDTNPNALRGIGAALRALPEGLVPEAVQRAELHATDLAILWARAPNTLETALEAALATSSARALRLLQGAPTSATARVVALIVTASKRKQSPVEPGIRAGLRAWVHDRVRDRAEGWRAAFDALALLD